MFGHLLKEITSFFEELLQKEETWWILFITGLAGAVFVPLFGLADVIAAIIYFL